MRLLLLSILSLIIFSCSSLKKLPSGIDYDDFVQLKQGDNIYYAKFETTNKQYREFLEDIKLKSPKKYNELNVQPEGWTKDEQFKTLGISFKNNYWSLETYNNYPVVNIPLEGARAYCRWLNTKTDIYSYRLPTSDEFAKLLNSVTIKYDSDKMEDYTGSNNPRKLNVSKLKFNLKFEKNYAVDGGQFTVIANNEVDKSEIPKERFEQNKYGIKHVVGNVHEFLSNGNYTGGSWDTLPSEVNAEQKYATPNPRVGFRIVMVRE